MLIALVFFFCQKFNKKYYTYKNYQNIFNKQKIKCYCRRLFFFRILDKVRIFDKNEKQANRAFGLNKFYV